MTLQNLTPKIRKAPPGAKASATPRDEYFRQQLETFVNESVNTYGIGDVAKHLQNAAADLVERNADPEFKKLAVKRFKERVGI